MQPAVGKNLFIITAICYLYVIMDIIECKTLKIYYCSFILD